MNSADETHAGDVANAEQVMHEVCDGFRSSPESAARGAVARRYAAIPSWYASGFAASRPCQPFAAPAPSWCVDRATARRLLREEDSR